MAKPTLALIPAAQGSKFYSVLPSSGVGDFSFTRSGSATRINAQGLIETVASGVSRLNYPMIDGVVKGCPHHILEPQRTQKFQYSEDFSQSFWNKASSSVTLTSKIAPNGTSNSVYNLVGTSANLYASGVVGVEHTISFYIKSNGQGKDKFKLRLGNNTSIEYTATNEWVRYEYTETPTTGVFGITTTSAPHNEFDLLVWGAQSEQGSFATSYIPNYGTSGGVTRSAETATGSGDASTFNDSEGVLMVEIAYLKDRGTSSPFKVERISISNATDTNRLFISNTAIANQIQVFVRNSTGISFNKTVTISDNTLYNKIVLKYKANDFSLWINGFELELDNTYSYLPSGLNVLKFEGASGSYDFYGNTKQLQYFDSALTDSELETLTSWTSFTDLANGQLYSIK